MDLDPEELEMMEEDGAYPPRFMVQICGSHAREPANALICFLGMSDAGDDTTELLLEPVAFGGLHFQCPCMPLQHVHSMQQHLVAASLHLTTCATGVALNQSSAHIHWYNNYYLLVTRQVVMDSFYLSQKEISLRPKSLCK